MAGLVVVLALLTAGLAVALGVGLRQRAEAIRRVVGATEQLGDDGLPDGGRGMERHLTRLERAASRATRREEEAAEVAGRLQGALDSVPHGIVVVDIDGEVVVRNLAASRFVEPRHGDALVADTVDGVLETARMGDPDSREIELFGPPPVSYLIMGIPLGPREQLRGAVAVVEDVTERRRLESIRRDFVTNISHELKTPIGALGLVAETLLDEDDPAVAERLTERIVGEAHRVNQSIDDLIALARLESNTTVTFRPLPVGEVVAEAIDRAGPALDAAAVDLEVDIDPGDLTIDGDRLQLVAALQNLLDNAAKYSDPSGSVRVRAFSYEGEVRIEVADCGMGIPTKDLERIFERFYRVDEARSRATGGTGLGLAIVRHVASNLGGRAEVSSRVGQGSTFTLVLPGTMGATTNGTEEDQTRGE